MILVGAKMSKISKNHIIPASHAITALRDSGYNDTASAIAELIDNSIEAKAKNIKVLAEVEKVRVRERVSQHIVSLAIFDDGEGMSPDVLSMCLQFGNGMRLNSRSGIGRFGIGLPNASISQCRRVDVYSWQNGECYFTYLDIDEVKKNDQQDIILPEKAKLPAHYKKHLSKEEIGESGTLIVWSQCDRLDIKRPKTLYDRMQRSLCRIYRHYLDDDDSYGDQRNIQLVICDEENLLESENVYTLVPNDPLYLMTPNGLPDHQNEATNLLHDMKTVEFELLDGTKHDIEIRFSIAKPEIQAIGGNTKNIGDHYKNNQGISFVRAGREIDFGEFGYIQNTDPRNRWWGCEIRFTPHLDEVFGVTNNKQCVRGVGYLDYEDFKKEHGDEADDLIDHDLKLKLRRELSKAVDLLKKSAMNIITKRKEGTRSNKGGHTGTLAEKIANEALDDNPAETQSKTEREQLAPEEVIEKKTQIYQEEDETLSEQEARELAEQRAGLILEIIESSWPGSSFMDVEVRAGTAYLTLNKRHPFYTEVYLRIKESGKSRELEALELLLLSYARAIDEDKSMTPEMMEHLELFRETWGKTLKNFLDRLIEE